ncbi:MAG: RNA-guided endonuclease InsQ/TnpB family protein, partial [Candidatus Bipolaricaulia bacterium]
MQLTWKARIVADEETCAVLRHLLLSATKVYNGLLWHLRQEQEATGKLSLSMSHLNQILQILPRSRELYADCAQQIFREVQWAWRSFFALHQAGKTHHLAPGFRRKNHLSPIRYPRVNTPKAGAKVWRKRGRVYGEISLGQRRTDGVRSLRFLLLGAPEPDFPLDLGRLVNLQITYDAFCGQFEARLVVEVNEAEARSGQTVAVDLGETWAIAACCEDGTEVLFSGRCIKTIRRYWQKVRAKVKPPSKDRPGMSRRYRQIARKESRQVHHALHIVSKVFVGWCKAHNVSRIVIGEPKDIREEIQYGARMNQRLHGWPWRMLVHMISYKAQREGLGVELVGEAYTSQRCPDCGHTSRSNRASRGVFRCRACGLEHHADLVGAHNLLEQEQGQVSPEAWLSRSRRSSGGLA